MPLVLPLLVALVGVTSPGPAGAVGPSGPAGPGDALVGSAASGSAFGTAEPTTVTLLTGDRVTVRGGAVLSVQPAQGREQVGFTQRDGDGRTVVVPSDAAPLVAGGQLDERLFDVAYLVEQGYDDASRGELPLLVQGRPEAVLAAVDGAGARVTGMLPATGMTAVAQRRGQAGAWWARLTGARVGAHGAGRHGAEQGAGELPVGVDRVWLDARLRVALEQSVPQVGAPGAWGAGFDGTGVRVAVLDTGIDTGHPDLAGRVTAARNFTPEPSAGDGNGHGTHVAGAVAGSGAASHGGHRGVAPGADLLNGKVCDRDGWCASSWVLAGMAWAAANGADVVNLSVGGDPTDGIDPLSAAVDTLTARYDVLFVAAAGNAGPAGTVASPAIADAALAVAAVDKADRYAGFSSRGPRFGDLAVKPDLAAPGVDVVSARAAGTSLGTPVSDHYTRASGTSMATPHVAGAAAILAQRHPGWSAGQLKAGLMSAAAATVEDAGAYQVGAGRLDVYRAVTQPVTQSVTGGASSLSFGVVRWPLRGPPSTRPVAYRNDGDQPVTLDLTLSATSADGAPAPDGLFALDAAEVTVPAGGTASVNVTMAPDGHPAGTFGGRLLASGGGVTVRTAFGVTLEPESYDLTVNLLDRDGRPPTADTAWPVYVNVVGYDTGDQYAFLPHGSVLRLPRGRYAVQGYVTTARPGADAPPDVAQLAYPEVELASDTTLTLDARTGRRIEVAVDRDTARPSALNSMMAVRLDDIGYLTYTQPVVTPSSPVAPDVYVGTAGSSQRFFHAVTARWEEPLVRLDVAGSRGFAVEVFHAEDIEAPRTPLLGTHRMGVVHGGAGTPAELAAVDVEGKLVVLDLPPELDAELPARVRNVSDAGGRAVLLDRPLLRRPPIASTEVLALPTLLAADPQRTQLVQLVRGSAARVTVTLRGVTASPYQYNLLLPTVGRVPDPPVYAVRVADLGAVDVDYRSTGTALRGSFVRPSFLGRSLPPVGQVLTAEPVRRTEYFSVGPISWQRYLNAGGGIWLGLTDGPVEFRRGARQREVVLEGIVGPSVAAVPAIGGAPASASASRRGDTIDVWVPMFVSAEAGRTMHPNAWPEGYTRLYRDGVLVGETGEAGRGSFPVPPESASYRLEVGAAPRFDHWTISTHVTATWTFTSASASTGVAVPLPLMAVRYGPALDDHNDGPAGRKVKFPVRVEHQLGTGVDIAELTVHASYDDGTTWHPVDLRRTQDHWRATLTNPTEGFVTLRATAVDADGNTVEQTIERAYGIR